MRPLGDEEEEEDKERRTMEKCHCVVSKQKMTAL